MCKAVLGENIRAKKVLKMNDDLISVIIPVYNVERYLEKCLNSIVKQSYSNLEILLVDDGSPDSCPQICDNWAQRDHRIKVIHKDNGGLSAARNAGLRVAKGLYICFVDSDDYVSEKFVETLHRLICDNHTEISAVSFQEVFSMENQEVGMEKEQDPEENVFEAEDALRQLFTNSTFANYAWNKMYKRDLFDDIQFPIGRKMEDLGTTYKLLLKAKKIAYSTEKLYFYYQRDDSILHKPSADFYRDKFELSRERYEKIENLYPNMIENNLFYLEVLLETYPKLYSSFKDYKWAEIAKITYSKSRKFLYLKEKIKYFLLVYCGFLYRYIDKMER